MRAYLQRCEVRLSTMHRVVTAFVSGAALMVLIPVFFKDVVNNLIQLLLNDFGNRFPAWGTAGWLLTGALYMALGYTLSFSLFIPLRALYLLFKDIIDFYIIVTTPGNETVQNPAFALTGVSFSSDESESVKRAVMAYQYRPESIDFTLPFSQAKRREYFQPMIDATRVTDPATNEVSARIIPRTREIRRLQAAGIVPADLGVEQRADIDHFNAALGIARSYDRRLVEEVAKTEMSLVRHSLYLRRLIFRYVSTIIIFIWTLLVLFMLLALLGSNALKANAGAAFVTLSAGCFVWALPVRLILHRPIVWIYRPLVRDGELHGTAPLVDPQLSNLESSLRVWHIAAVGAALIALVLSAVSMAIS